MSTMYSPVVPEQEHVKCCSKESISLRNQLMYSFSVMTLVTGGITLAICLGMLYALGDSAYTNSDQIILRNTKSNARNIGSEIANTVDLQLRSVAESITMVSSQYSYLLLNDYPNRLKNQSSYKEFKFQGACYSPDCPSDYGLLYTRSRLPYLPGFINGSLEHTSTFLYSSYANSAIRNDADWANTFTNYPYLKIVKDNLAIQDNDFKIMYSQGPNSTVMFYLSAQIFSNGGYHVLHRTYPGILKNDSTYDPSQRSWFINAPVGAFNLYGPYKETFTKQYVVTLSSKMQYSDTNGYTDNLVSAATMLLEDLAQIVNAIEYTDDGFGAIIRRSNQQVLVWNNRTDLYDDNLQSFRTVSYFDANLATYDLTSDKIIEYTDPEGNSWVVSCTSFFGTGTSNTDTLVMLVFSKKNEVNAPLHDLRSNIDDTTSSVTISTVIIVCCTIGGVLIFIYCLVYYITYPFSEIRKISESVMHVSAQDEERRDYGPIVDRAFHSLGRTDEVGVLASDYYHLICTLHNKTTEKQNTPKYPYNPFYLPTIPDLGNITLKSYISLYNQYFSAQGFATIDTSAVINEEEKPDTNSLDVLGDLSKMQQKTPTNLVSSQSNNITRENNQYAALASFDIERPEAVPLVELPKKVKVGWFSSIKSQLYATCTLLIAGMLIAMIITIVTLQSEGDSWATDTGNSIEVKQVQNLQGIALTKATYVQSYFKQMNFDLLVGAKYFSSLMDLNITHSNWEAKGDYDVSYSVDFYNNYYYSGSSENFQYFSGYYYPSDAQCVYSTCSASHDSTETRLTSMLNFKLRSYFHQKSYISFLQGGWEQNELTRYWPYQQSSTVSYPTQCYIQDISTSYCYNLWFNSKCNPDSLATTYPPYNVKCRTWYVDAVDNDPSMAYFQYPRTASSGSFVLTGAVPIRSQNSFSQQLYGVLNSNFLAQEFADAINQLTILSSGYVYLIDKQSTENIVLHPKLTKTCSTLQCCEDFQNTNEYLTFNSTILTNFREATTVDVNQLYWYEKNGKSWALIAKEVDFASVKYILMVTVPHSEVYEVSNKTQDSINNTIVTMIVVFVIILVLFVIVLFYFTNRIIKEVVHPIDDMRNIIQLLLSPKNYSDIIIPEHASSLDLSILLQSFSQLFIVLKFLSCDNVFYQTNPTKAKQIFSDSLQLFRLIHNKNGEGSCLNNLAAISLMKKDFITAEKLYLEAIQIVKDLIEIKEQKLNKEEINQSIEAANTNENETSPTTKSNKSNNGQKKNKKHDTKYSLTKLRQVLSDREGNLAVTYLEKGDFPAAFALLERLLLEDKRLFYLKGCVVKQGILGQYYLKQKEIQSAERIFTSLLQFIQNQYALLPTEEIKETAPFTVAELHAADQIALFNMAMLHQNKMKTLIDSKSAANSISEEKELAEKWYWQAICKPGLVHWGSFMKVLVSLQSLYNNEEVKEFHLLLEKLHLDEAVKKASGGNGSNDASGPKNIIFCLDYSGSMSGTKIRSAVENLLNIFDNYCFSSDSIGLYVFSSTVKQVFKLTNKAGNEENLRGLISSQVSPNGSTAFHDCIQDAVVEFSKNSLSKFSSSNWIVALTDGEDNSSKLSFDNLISYLLSYPSVGMIVVGVGNDLMVDNLVAISKGTGKGAYVSAEGNKKSIDEAFGKVAAIIQSQVLIEDI